MSFSGERHGILILKITNRKGPRSFRIFFILYVNTKKKAGENPYKINFLMSYKSHIIYIRLQLKI